MHWILQEDIFNEVAYNKFVECLDRLNISYSVHKIIPFIGELIPSPQPNQNAICFGSYSMKYEAERLNLTPGVFDLESQDFNVQIKYWKDHMLNHDSKIYKLKDNTIINDWDDDELKFIRPINDSKAFSGTLYSMDDFLTWQTNICDLQLDFGDIVTPDMLIQIARQKEIWKEHRFWIVNGEIITASTYNIGGKSVYKEVIDDNLFEFVYDKIRLYQPHNAFCIDVAETPNGLKIIEINTLNSCQFYAADLQKLIIALEENYGT